MCVGGRAAKIRWPVAHNVPAMMWQVVRKTAAPNRYANEGTPALARRRRQRCTAGHGVRRRPKCEHVYRHVKAVSRLLAVRLSISPARLAAAANHMRFMTLDFSSANSTYDAAGIYTRKVCHHTHNTLTTLGTLCVPPTLHDSALRILMAERVPFLATTQGELVGEENTVFSDAR
ncbi:hypothetical protein J6590_033195 [Homalodisca vitripennis]|nr:hypothetical protein J6590_033195 [Homalodisca vitripennis]